MNIHTASMYLKQGYRIRRPQWNSSYSLLVNEYDDIEKIHLLTHSKVIDGQLEYIKREQYSSLLDLSLDDLLAEDWELVK